MSEIRRIQDQLRRSIEGDAWHGPALHGIMAGLGAARAAGRPLEGAHTPWEIVEHVAVWLEIVARRLAGEVVEPTPAEDWPPVERADDAAWAAVRERLDVAHGMLQAALEAMPDADLEKRVPGQAYDNYVMLHGAIQHTLYHAGQVAILAKGPR